MSRLSGTTVVTSTPSAWTSLAASTIESFLLSVPGARLGDFVFTAVASDDGNEYVTFGRVNAADSVRVAIFPDGAAGGVPLGSELTVKVVHAEDL